MTDAIEDAAKEETLWQRVKLSVQALDKTSPIVDPTQVADDAFPKLTPELIKFAAHLQLRQIAREILRTLHKNGTKTGGARDNPHTPTFGPEFDLLQVRYPKAHVSGRPQGYAMLEAMTETDWNWNIDQLLGESGVKNRHAAQLEAWGRLKGFKRPATLPIEGTPA